MPWPPKDGTPYMPANGTDGGDFEWAWCSHCLNRSGEGPWEDEFGTDVDGACAILDEAFYGQQPREWKYRNGAPHCTAFREDPANPVRCPYTLELEL